MRGGVLVLLVLLICLVVVTLYIFLGRSQITRGIVQLRDENTALQATLDNIRYKEEHLPELMARLPHWSSQLALFNEAIPTKFDDHIFLGNLVNEFEARDIEILSLSTMPGTPWLGDITEEMAAELESLGINVNAARSIKVAFYSATVVGEFDDVLNAFENMKKHNRLYTLDFVSGPASTGAGAVTETLDQSLVPITFSGSLYYGISEQEVSQETLTRVFSEAIAGPVARKIFDGVRSVTKDVPLPEGESKGGGSAADQASATSMSSNELLALVFGSEEVQNQ